MQSTLQPSLISTIQSSLVESSNAPLSFIDDDNSFLFRAGTVGDPTAGTGNTASATTWFAGESLPVVSQLTKIQFYMNAASTVYLLLASPRALGGFDVSIIATKSAAIGLNSYTVAASELPATTIPAGSYIGIKCATQSLRYTLDSTAYGRARSQGFGYVSGFTSSPGVFYLDFAFQDELSFAWEAITTRGDQTDVINETFGTSRPAGAMHGGTAWTYTAGSAIPGATGIANRLFWAKSSKAHLQNVGVEFQFDDASGKLVIGKQAVSSLSVDGTLISISIATNQIEIYATQAGPTILPAVFATETITEFTLVTGRTYLFEFVKVNKQIIARITDTVTDESQEFDFGISASHGHGYGQPVAFSLAGTLHISRVRWTLGNTRPKFMIYGDSITEGTGATSNLSNYAGQLCASGKGMFCGDGGAKTHFCLRDLIFDVSLVMPKYAVLLGGINNTESDIERDAAIAEIELFWRRCLQYGIIPIICTLTTYNDAARQTRIDAIRTAILGFNTSDSIGIIRMDLAVGGVSGSVYNAALASDSVHPNQAGYDLMYARAIADQPAVFN